MINMYINQFCKFINQQFNPFLVDVPILYPLKTPGVFRGCKMGTLTRNELSS